MRCSKIVPLLLSVVLVPWWAVAQAPPPGPPPCLGRNDGNEKFGRTLAVGDFDGDGYADVAVGTPQETAWNVWTGLVYVFRGGAGGLTPWLVLSRFGQGSAEEGDHFGIALAAADVDGDGRDDLAVGALNARVGTVRSGRVFVFRGAAGGPQPWFTLRQSAGADEEGDEFGAALAFGDTDGDGHPELAVGTPGEDTLGQEDTGYVWIYRGSPSGLTAAYGLHHASIFPAREYENFGASLAFGDFDGDGRADLAAGLLEYEAWSAVYVFRAGAGSSTMQVVQRLDQAGLGANERGDYFGTALAAGDFDHDGKDDLAVGAPGESNAGHDRNGYVFVFRGGTQLSAWRGVGSDPLAPPVSSAGFGAHLAADDLNGDGLADLAVSRSEDGGRLFLYRGTASGPSGWTILDQTGLGNNEFLDGFGAAMATGDLNGDGLTDLVVGAPGESPGSDPNSGYAFAFRGAAGSAPIPWTGFGQEASGCAPQWPAPPVIDLIGRTASSLTARLVGDPDITILRACLDPGQCSPMAGPEAVWTFSGLAADAEYCVAAYAWDGVSMEWSDRFRRCFRTAAAPPPGPQEYDWTVRLERQEPWEGPIWYEGQWGPVNDATLVGVRVPNALVDTWVHFLKPGHDNEDCDDPSAVVSVQDGHEMTAQQMSDLFGSALPQETVAFRACVARAQGLSPEQYDIVVRYQR